MTDSRRSVYLDKALFRIRLFSGLFGLYSVSQVVMYSVESTQTKYCHHLRLVLIAAASVYAIQALLCLLIVTTIKRRQCYWTHLSLIIFIEVCKFILLVTTAVITKKRDTDVCGLTKPIRIIFSISSFVYIIIIALVGMMVRRMRKSKAFKLHKRSPLKRSFLEYEDEEEEPRSRRKENYQL